jgi:hypothetical protein
MPTNENCLQTYSIRSNGDISIRWVNQAWKLYEGRDVPVGLFNDVSGGGPYGYGCAVPTHGRGAVIMTKFASHPWFNEHWYVSGAAYILTHELLHVFGFTDTEMDKEMPYSSFDTVPSTWMIRIQEAAQWFQMPLPDDYAF